MTIDYSWMNSALAWIAPVAAQVNSFYVYPNKLLAFSGVTVSEYDTPFALTKEPFGLQFQPAKTINWSKVTGFTVGKTCNVNISGGLVKLPMIEHFFDPEPISLEGQSYPASDVAAAVQQTIGAVDRGVLGWPNCIHFDGDSVISTPADTSVLHHVTLSWELERPAELSYDSAKMIAGKGNVMQNTGIYRRRNHRVAVEVYAIWPTQDAAIYSTNSLLNSRDNIAGWIRLALKANRFRVKEVFDHRQLDLATGYTHVASLTNRKTSHL